MLRIVSRAREGEEGFSGIQGIVAKVLSKFHNQIAWGSEDSKVLAGVGVGIVY